MKNIVHYVLLMFAIIILLPLLAVKGCTLQRENISIKDETPTDGTVKVKVYITSENKVKEMPLEEYVKEVVAAEMPAEFDMEALKAQAVAARTYTYGRIKGLYAANEDVHHGADICTDPTHCQAWISKENAKKNWGIFSSYKYWNKIEKAVEDTKNIIIVYEKSVINPVFHANSGGRTENAEEVWEGGSVPYLRSVQSSGEDNSSAYKAIVSLKEKDFTDKLKSEYPAFTYAGKDIVKDIKTLGFTEGGRVKSIKIGNLTLKGTDIRRIFSLRSANFTIEKDTDGTIKIITLGNGHGVGMSQWGANYLAKNGGTYEEILKYYYTGVELDIIR